MKTKNLYWAGITALTLALVLAACNNLTGPGSNTLPGETIPQGMGLARIRLNAGESSQDVRTALPDMTAYHFTLQFTASGKTTVNEVLSGGMSVTVALEPTTWTLTVMGYTDQDELKVIGSAGINISEGTESSFDVYLTPAFSSGSTGILDYNISFPETVSWTSFALYPLDGTPGASQEIDISAGAEGTASDTRILSVGSYRAVIDLYDGTLNRAATWTGVAHIYGGLATPLTRVFGATDFADCAPIVTGTTLADKLTAALISPEGSYTIILDDTVTDLATFMPQTLDVNDSNITITIRGDGKTVQLNSGSAGSLFTLGATNGSLTLILQDVTLQGISDNTAPLAQVNSGGTLEMKAGSSITGNTNTSSIGGGVSVSFGGTFTMNGGTVSGNESPAYGGGVYVAGSGTFTMNGGTVSDNNASSSFSAYGGGVCVDNGGIFTMNGGAVSGNEASSSASAYGGGVYVANGGTFVKQPGAIIHGLNESDSSLKNTAGTDGNAVYVSSYPVKNRYTTAGTGITLDSSLSGSSGGWEEPYISDISYGETWALQSDGRRQSPTIGDDSVTKARVSFTSIGANASITIQLDVSSESGYDYAFISTLDNDSATYNSGNYPGSSISGSTLVTVTIPVPTAGSHFIDVGYRKDYSVNSGSDCAWFKVIE